MVSNTARRRSSINKKLPRFFQYLVLSLITLIVLVPIVIMIFGALKTSGEIFLHPYSIPIPAHWDNIIEILTSKDSPTFWTLLLNSLMVGLATTIGVLIVCSLAAFVFARMQFRGKGLAFNFLTLGLMFPITIAIMPVYLVVRQLHLIDTLQAVIFVQIAFAISANMLILRGFFTSIPMELQDASYIDGCTTFGFFWRILLPLARPALAAIAALTLIVSWNDLLTPLVILNTDKLWTLPLGTMQFQGQYSSDLGMIAAFVTLTTIPAILFYLIAERQIVSGLTAGALKG
jgi:raffinose/stachyose/melibiose transport system permease protein